MNEPLMLFVAGAAGLVLGAVFFGGLWWTVRRGVSSPRPVLWFVGSMLMRTGIVVAGFYFVGSGQWQRLLGCLLGFVIARFLVMRLTRAPAEEKEPRGTPRDIGGSTSVWTASGTDDTEVVPPAKPGRKAPHGIKPGENQTHPTPEARHAP